MSVMKVIEVLAQSEKGWEDAAQQAIREASKSIRGIKSLYVENMQAVVVDGKMIYRLDAKLSFEVSAEEQEGRSEKQETHPAKR